jgi:hypothetical protein
MQLLGNFVLTNLEKKNQNISFVPREAIAEKNNF